MSEAESARLHVRRQKPSLSRLLERREGQGTWRYLKHHCDFPYSQTAEKVQPSVEVRGAAWSLVERVKRYQATAIGCNLTFQLNLLHPLESYDSGAVVLDRAAEMQVVDPWIHKRVVLQRRSQHFSIIDFRPLGEPISAPETDKPSDLTSEFQPSVKLANYVVRGRKAIAGAMEGEGTHGEPDLSVHAAQDLIKESAIGLFTSMSRSIAQAGGVVHRLSSEGKFESAIAKALLFRVHVNFYETVEYIAQLYYEILAAARRGAVKGPGWALSVSGDGELTLVSLGTTFTQNPTKRARARPMRYGAASG